MKRNNRAWYFAQRCYLRVLLKTIIMMLVPEIQRSQYTSSHKSLGLYMLNHFCSNFVVLIRRQIIVLIGTITIICMNYTLGTESTGCIANHKKFLYKLNNLINIKVTDFKKALNNQTYWCLAGIPPTMETLTFISSQLIICAAEMYGTANRFELNSTFHTACILGSKAYIYAASHYALIDAIPIPSNIITE